MTRTTRHALYFSAASIFIFTSEIGVYRDELGLLMPMKVLVIPTYCTYTKRTAHL